MGSLRLVCTLFRGIGVLCVVRALVGLFDLEPWVGWAPPDLHGFYKWVFDALGLLNDFVKQVVIDRRDASVRRCLALGDLGAWPYASLQPDFVLPSSHLVVRDFDAEFREAWMLFFSRSGHPVVTLGQFLSFVDPFLPQEAVQDLPHISGQDLLDTARAKQSNAGGLDGWAWNEIKALPLPWFSGLAILLNIMELASGFAGCPYCYDTTG